MVFPVLFNSADQGAEAKWYVELLRSKLTNVSQDKILLFTCIWIPIVFLVRAVSGYANSYLVNFCGLKVLEGLRIDIFDKLQSLPLAFYSKNRSGDLLSRLMNDTNMLRQVIAKVSSDLIKQPATLLASIGVLIFLSFQSKSVALAMIPLISVPICVFFIRSVGKKLSKRAKQVQAEVGNISSILTENLQAPIEIRSFNLQEQQSKGFRSRIHELLRYTMKVVKYKQLISPSIEFVGSVGLTTAIYVGVKNGMTLADFLGLSTAMYMSYDPIKKLGAIHTHFKQGEAALDRLEYILNAENTLEEEKDAQRPEVFKESLIFKNVSFAYTDEPVLKKLNLEVNAGDTVALVGESGSGKSSFVSLIPRLYDPVSGEVLLDGVNLKSVAKDSLRNLIAYVPQTSVLFAGSLADNIRLGRLEATQEEIEEAAKKAFAHDFIMEQEQGYDTYVGERGASLSGGQRQRIAIARAFLKNAPILILDEATSALDSASEAKIQEALEALVEGRTTFVIAHRFSTIRFASRILVFEKTDEGGRISADGSYEELAANNQLFKKLASMQS